MKLSHKIEATVQIGKNGLTKTLLLEIDKQLKKRKTIKVKILKNAVALYDRDEMISLITEGTNSIALARTGNVFILQRKF